MLGIASGRSEMVSGDWKWVGEVSKIDFLLNTGVQTQLKEQITECGFVPKEIPNPSVSYVFPKKLAKLFLEIGSGLSYFGINRA